MGERREGVSRFSVSFFLYLIAEKNRGETLYCVTDFGYRKMLCLRGLYHDFLSRVSCLAVPKNFIGEMSVSHKKSVIEKLHGKEGG